MMKSKVIKLNTNQSSELVDITDDVGDAIRGVERGICVLFTTHTTAALFINENESGLRSDILSLMEKLVPRGDGYGHDRIDDNAHSHLRACLLSPSLTIPIEQGKLALGTWQRVFFAEFDGPRTRRVLLRIIED